MALRQDPNVSTFTYQDNDSLNGKYNFTVNSAVSSVDIVKTAISDPDPNIAGNSILGLQHQSFNKLNPHEGFTVLSVCITTDNLFNLQQSTKGTTGLSFSLKCKILDSIYDLWNFTVPYLNAEISMNHFISLVDLKPEATSLQGAQLAVELLEPTGEKNKISMLNVPSSLDTKIVTLTPFLKIAHTWGIFA